MLESIYPVGYTVEQQDRSGRSKESFKKNPDTLTAPKYGTITKVLLPSTKRGKAIRIKVSLDDEVNNITQESQPRPYVLTHYVTEVAMLYGDELVGLRVRIDSPSPRNDDGLATIVNTDGTGDLEMASKLRDFGTLLAPAGSGLV